MQRGFCARRHDFVQNGIGAGFGVAVMRVNQFIADFGKPGGIEL
jgi:hypothetical protein